MRRKAQTQSLLSIVAAGCLATVSFAQCHEWLPVENRNGPSADSVAAVFYQGEWLAADNLGVSRWDGVRWAPIHPRLATCRPSTLVVAQGLLIIGASESGGIDGQNGSGLLSWDGHTPRAMPGFIGGVGRFDIAEHQGELYCSLKAGTGLVRTISRWDGTTWVAVPAVGTPQHFVGVESWNNRLFAVTGEGALYEFVGGLLRQILPSGGLRAATDVRRLESTEQGLVIPCANASFESGPDTFGLILWDGFEFQAMGSGLDTRAPAVATVHQGRIFAVGSFTRSGVDASNNVAYWDGARWRGDGFHPLTSANSISSGGGNLAVKGSDLTIRDNETWVTLSRPLLSGTISDLSLYRGEVYASGNLTSFAGTWLKNIARREGIAWRPLGEGLEGLPFALCPYNDELYVGGQITAAGGSPVSRLARWNGVQWRDVGAGVDSRVDSMVVYRGELVVGGRFERAGGVPARFLARWNGATWSAFPGTFLSGNGGVTAMAVVGDDLYVSGGFRFIDDLPVNYIARWDGSAWHALGPGLGGTTGADSISSYRGMPVVGASLFRNGDAVVSYGVAGWNGTSWVAFGDPTRFGTGTRCLSIGEFSGSLYTVGVHRTASGQSSIERFDGTVWTRAVESTGPTPTSLLVRDREIDIGNVFGSSGNNMFNGYARIGCPCDPPTVTESTADLTLCPGGRGTLSVRATGENLIYQWRRQGVPIGDATGPELAFVNASREAAASYDCLVFNDCGSTRAGPFQVRFCFADYGCDGFIDWWDVLAFHHAMDSGSTAADLNADGVVDLNDLLQFYEHFEAGCGSEGPPGS